MDFLSKSKGSWVGTFITIFILFCGIFSEHLSKPAQMVVKRPSFRISMIVIILISKLYSDILAICLAIIIITVLHVYSKNINEYENVRVTGMAEAEHNQYVDELILIKQLYKNKQNNKTTKQ
jgi:hypothetical protein